MKNWVDVSPPAGNIYPLTIPAKRFRQDSTRLPTWAHLRFDGTPHELPNPNQNITYTLTDEEYGFLDVAP
jgi:hypothetical protein